MKLRCLFISALVAGVTFGATDSLADSEVGYLFVESQPKHARVVIDGDDRMIVVSPLLCTLSVGPHELTVYARDNSPSTVGIFITADKILRKSIRFDGSRVVEQAFVGSPEMYTVNGNLSIVTDIFGGVIFLDSIRMNVPVPTTLRSIPAGIHHVRIEHSGLGFDTTITIHAGVTETMQLNLFQLREVAPLDVASPPTVEIGSPPPFDLVTIVVNLELPGCRYHRISPPQNGTPFDSFQIALPGEYDAVPPPDYPEIGDASEGDMRTLTFHRSREPEWDEESMSIRGVDAIVRIITEDRVDVVSHRFAVDSTMSLRPQLSNLEVGMPVRLAKRYAQATEGGAVTFEVELYVNQAMKFATLENLLPIRKQFRLKTDLNDGDDINVRIRVDTDGEIFFRYW